MTTCKLLFNKPTCTGKRVFEWRSGVAAVQHNTKLEETHKQCRRTKICNLTFISKFQGLALWKIQKRPLSPLHTGVCSCCQVWRRVLCAPLKAWWANVPFPRRCAPPSVASSRHFYNVFISGRVCKVHQRCGEAGLWVQTVNTPLRCLIGITHCWALTHTLGDSLGEFVSVLSSFSLALLLSALDWGQGRSANSIP